MCVCNCEHVYETMHAHLTWVTMPLVTTDSLSGNNDHLNFSEGAIINVMSRGSGMWKGELGGVEGKFSPESVKEIHGEFPVQTSQLVPWPRDLQIRRYTQTLNPNA